MAVTPMRQEASQFFVFMRDRGTGAHPDGLIAALDLLEGAGDNLVLLHEIYCIMAQYRGSACKCISLVKNELRAKKSRKHICMLLSMYYVFDGLFDASYVCSYFSSLPTDKPVMLLLMRCSEKQLRKEGDQASKALVRTALRIIDGRIDSVLSWGLDLDYAYLSLLSVFAEVYPVRTEYYAHLEALLRKKKDAVPDVLVPRLVLVLSRSCTKYKIPEDFARTRNVPLYIRIFDLALSVAICGTKENLLEIIPDAGDFVLRFKKFVAKEQVSCGPIDAELPDQVLPSSFSDPGISGPGDRKRLLKSSVGLNQDLSRHQKEPAGQRLAGPARDSAVLAEIKSILANCPEPVAALEKIKKAIK